MQEFLTNPSLWGLILAVIGLVVAAWQVKDARSLATELRQLRDDARSHANELLNIRDSLSTRFIGEFPYYIPEIARLISQARHDIVIVCDVPAYGHFSNYRAYVDYKNALTAKLAEDIRVEIVCLEKNQRIRRHIDQFAGPDKNKVAENWASRLERDDFQDRLKAFIARERPASSEKITQKVTPEQIPFEKFQALVDQAHERTLQNDFRNAVVCCANIDLPVYFWIIDGVRAIFSIANFASDAREYGTVEIGFITLDPKLISAFKELSRQYHSTGAVNDCRSEQEIP